MTLVEETHGGRPIGEPLMCAMAEETSEGARLVSRVICPHCWHRFAPEDVLWIAEHGELYGDTLLGRDKQQRFLPSRFTPLGDAIDERGITCRKLACPQCHLSVPRGQLESDSLFLSMLGGPGSGKSYFLASAVSKLREVLTNSFGLAFQDADPGANASLNEAEDRLFQNEHPNRIYPPEELIKKTDLEGNLYDTVDYGQHVVEYPRPYMFSIQIQEKHPFYAKKRLDQMLCLYDNAGEHWQPGSDKENKPVTRHVALSRVLIYLFDPTSDRQFSNALRQGNPNAPEEKRIYRQDTILNEAAARIRSIAGLSQNAKIDRPLIVVVPKYDAWSHLMSSQTAEEPWITSPKLPVAGFCSDVVDQVSVEVRKLLNHYCPSIVASAEGLSNKVIYIPVSALGDSAMVRNPSNGKWGIRPSEIRPYWVTVPFLYALQMAQPGLIPRMIRKSGASSTRSAIY